MNTTPELVEVLDEVNRPYTAPPVLSTVIAIPFTVEEIFVTPSSPIVTVLFCTSLPVVASKRTMALSVALPGPATLASSAACKSVWFASVPVMLPQVAASVALAPDALTLIRAGVAARRHLPLVV